MRLGCMLSIFVPYELAAHRLEQLLGLQVSASSLWNWVSDYGATALKNLEAQLSAQAAGEPITPEVLAPALAALPLAISADGVMVPMRPSAGTAKGKTLWEEIKVGILARLGQRVTRNGTTAPKLWHRRLVAVLGDIHQFMPQIKRESHRQGLTTAPEVIWLSDGGRGFWRIFHTCFADYAVGILDFYHAAGHLWRVATVLFDQHTEQQAWFKQWRHALRHGQHHQLLAWLTRMVNTDWFTGESLSVLCPVQAYFQRHHAHIRYQSFDKQSFPLGSGMVESACKWLIQQRFKGVGMRWSDDGLDHLLALRVAWVNQRFNDLFPLLLSPQDAIHPSHNT